MRALVTGANGFVGTHLRDHLVEAGHDVVGVDHRDGDITEPGVVDALVAGATPEVIYHLAGAANVGDSWRDPMRTWEVNATATLRLLEAARAHGVRRVLVTSSADVYGTVDTDALPLTESSPIRPASPYAASKLAAEQAARQAWFGWGTETIIVRAFNHVGPGQPAGFVVPALASAIAENERDGGTTIPIGDLSARRDFTDVRDVVRAYGALMSKGDPGETYCVCSGVDTSVRELADLMLANSDADMELVIDPDRIRPVELPVLRGSNAKIVDTTGWQPELPLDRTVADVLDEHRRRVRAPADKT